MWSSLSFRLHTFEWWSTHILLVVSSMHRFIGLACGDWHQVVHSHLIYPLVWSLIFKFTDSWLQSCFHISWSFYLYLLTRWFCEQDRHLFVYGFWDWVRIIVVFFLESRSLLSSRIRFDWKNSRIIWVFA